MNHLNGSLTQLKSWLTLKQAKGPRWLNVLVGEQHRVHRGVAQQARVALVDITC
jgi:hypothetical protein